MRLWSFHPRYLDNIGLSRAINESISGYKALEDWQRDQKQIVPLHDNEYPPSWKNHSQLVRFKIDDGDKHLQDYIDVVLSCYVDRKLKSYNSKTIRFMTAHLYHLRQLTVTNEQLLYEWQHYLKKIQKRSPKLYEEYILINTPIAHPLFKVVSGEIESWEKVK
jgi:hypothetical protein